MKNRELHLHIDGSLRVDTVSQLIKEQRLDLDLPKVQLRELMKVPSNCKNLNDYLKRFELPLKVLQNCEAIERVSYELIMDLSKLGMNYSEVRFAPQLSTLKGCTQEQVLRAAIKGIKKAEKELGNFKAGLIVCMMRGEDNEIQNKESIYLAKKYYGDTVCALDIAGAEAIYPTKNFEDLLKEAKKMELPLTVHAGEAGVKEDLEVALKVNADRIGHGILSIKYDDIIKQLIETGITLEVCVSSNLQTRVVSSFQEHPVRKLFDKGVRLAISSDNMTVSDTNIINEFEILKKYLNFTEQELNIIRKNTYEASFIK